MLALKDIAKTYYVGDGTVEALRGINIEFRNSEFVSILGPSGCGKTTMLNIIGGLDRYTTGDLTVNGVSTKKFRDSDWDAYRNQSIGFVFQSYNLIPHQTVLANVELAMTLSGVPRSERKRRALEVLERVGLGDQANKKPNQLSGGQMQRVAIARALVNNPDILLADEPTGSLDSETSTQIAEILAEIARDRLVILVTHNSELAQKYSTRIVHLLDGKITSDSNPYDSTRDAAFTDRSAKDDLRAKRKPSMSLGTALSLSLNNLMTKKARTLLTSFAGSIGIIGIALILALSSGMRDYIGNVQQDTMSSYPLSIEQSSIDMTALLAAARSIGTHKADHPLDKVYSYDVMADMMSSLLSESSTNDLKAFKKFIEDGGNGIGDYVNDIKYGYATPMNIYRADTANGVFRVHPSSLLMDMSSASPMGTMGMMRSRPGSDVWEELLDNRELLELQYDVLAGRMPEDFDEVAILVNKDNEITDYALYSLGLEDPDEVARMMRDISVGEKISSEQVSFTYEELLDLTFKLVPGTDHYEKVGGVWIDRSRDDAYMAEVIKNAKDIKVVGILRPSEGAAESLGAASIGYTSALTTYFVNAVKESQIVREQMTNPEVDVFTGKPFARSDGSQPLGVDPSSLSPDQQAYLASLSPEERAAFLESNTPTSKSTYEQNMLILGVTDMDNPNRINIYPKDFESKTKIKSIIDDYNKQMNDSGNPEGVIQYADYLDLMLSSVTSVINAISYILIAFVAISLVVSSIMIGVITYISVLERTKEIGILRSVGASKSDISRVFNAETLIIGFVAGAIGIGATLLLCVPANVIISRATRIPGVAALPPLGGIALLAISMTLTFIAGLIPSRIAAKKDPVVALRTE
ncbi:MAG: ATP-binding cassette domain-containing protein [Bacillota bacterium]